MLNHLGWIIETRDFSSQYERLFSKTQDLWETRNNKLLIIWNAQYIGKNFLSEQISNI